jgi:chromosome segregation protein
MRLKKLILHGFKSFADRTDFVFDSPITGIVGPNGCGKSNVVDGFKWVLGEQSAKSLRGEAMLDVIFNGSGGRKPAGMAEVVLVFDNPRRPDGSRTLNLDADEVAVGRRLYRDATSEYTINNSAARLRDIRELFLDTGVGVDAYSVIEQGRVSALLEANPAERRMIFEEAAGISKYKIKKKEAQRKLEKVDQNLLRLNDIVEEVEKRLRSVKVQAGRARTYREHAARLREMRLEYALREYHTQHAQLQDLHRQEEDARFRLDDVTADLQRSQETLAEKRQSAETLAQHKQATEYELVQTRAALQSAQQRQRYAREQLEQMADQLAAFEHDRAAMEEKLAAVREALGGEEQALQRLTEELSSHRRHIEQRQGAFHDGQLQLNQINREIEQHKSAVLDLMRKLATTNSRLGAIEIERKNITAQQARLGERRRVVVGELEALEARRAEIQTQLDGVLQQIVQQQQATEARKQQATQLGRQIAALSEQLGAAREHRSGLLSRQKLLKDLEAKREGVSEGVKAVL